MKAKTKKNEENFHRVKNDRKTIFARLLSAFYSLPP